MSEKIINTLEKNYRQVITILLLVIGAIPYLQPLGLPLTISREVTNFYNSIELLPEGSIVLVNYEFSAGNWGELGGCAIAVNEQLTGKHHKIVYFATHLEGPMLLNKVLDTQQGGREKLGTYGEDWVNLGFIPGGETAIASMMAEPNGMWTTFSNKDAYGNNFDTLPMMEMVRSNEDIALCIALTTGGIEKEVRQMYTPYQVTIIAASVGADWPGVKMAIDAGQVAGGVASLRGSAEYEKMVNKLGIATSAIEALSFNHLLILGLIALGNISFLRAKKKAKGGANNGI